MPEQSLPVTINRKAPCNLIGLGLSLLMLYILSGVAEAPFHGDESTILYMANDWFLLREQGISALHYRPDPPDLVPQILRLINGTLAPLTYGALLEAAQLDRNILNRPWAWDLGWWENIYYEHMPRPEALFIGRWASALMLCLAVALFFAAARKLIGAPQAFWATLLFGSLPAVLLNGRRAMFEGATFLGAALVWFAAARIAVGRARSRDWLLLGAASGVAMAAKHINVLLIAPIFLALLWQSRARRLKALSDLLIAAVSMIAIFLLLNPAWWSAPLQVPEQVLFWRNDTLAAQSEAFGRPLSLGERLEALIAFPFGAPQYFEDTLNPWRDWLGDSIPRYERGLQGIAWYALAPLIYLALLLGALSLLRRRTGALIGLAAFGIGFALLMTNTLMWQRYYLPLAFPLAMLVTLGLAQIAAILRHMRPFRHA
jgi:hypothetical protein